MAGFEDGAEMKVYIKDHNWLYCFSCEEITLHADDLRTCLNCKKTPPFTGKSSPYNFLLWLRGKIC